MARKKRIAPEINAGSMADVAFLLLIFFLVTTTMDTNSGMMRQLPPIPPKDQIQEEIKVIQRNVFVVLINRADQLLVNGSRMEVSELRDKTKEFFTNPTDNPKLSEKKMKEIEFFGTVDVSKGVVSLQNDRGTTYDKYIAVQNELVAAINELRNEASKQKFGKLFDDLDSKQQDAVQKYYPLAISEAEPKTYKK
jgi:biopolymer transport protein ExbD